MLSQNIQIDYYWPFIAAFFSALTIILIKYYVKTSNYFLLLFVLLSEISLVCSYIKLLETGNVVIQFALVKIISIFFVLLPGIIFFDTKLTNYKILGLILGIISIYLLNS